MSHFRFNNGADVYRPSIAMYNLSSGSVLSLEFVVPKYRLGVKTRVAFHGVASRRYLGFIAVVPQWNNEDLALETTLWQSFLVLNLLELSVHSIFVTSFYVTIQFVAVMKTLSLSVV